MKNTYEHPTLSAWGTGDFTLPIMPALYLDRGFIEGFDKGIIEG